MAALTTGDIDITARRISQVIYVEASALASENLDTLKAMVQAIDGAMEGLPTALPNQSATLQVNLNQIAVAAAPNTTLAQRAIALQIWAAKKANLF